MADLNNLLHDVDEALLHDDDDDADDNSNHDGISSLVASDNHHQQQQQQEEEVEAQNLPSSQEDWDEDDREDVHISDTLEDEAAVQNNTKNNNNNFSMLDDDDDEYDHSQTLGASYDITNSGGANDAATVDDDHFYSRLKQLWQHEVACPELLPIPKRDDDEDQDVFEKISEELEKREETHAALLEEKDDIHSLMASILKVDMDRTKFMLADLMRTRLMKIQEYPLHSMKNLTDRMTQNEARC